MGSGDDCFASESVCFWISIAAAKKLISIRVRISKLKKLKKEIKESVHVVVDGEEAYPWGRKQAEEDYGEGEERELERNCDLIVVQFVVGFSLCVCIYCVWCFGFSLFRKKRLQQNSMA